MPELDSESEQCDLTLHHVSYCFSSHVHAMKADWEAPQTVKGEGDTNEFSLTSHF